MNLAQALEANGTIASMARELDVDEGTAQAAARALIPTLVAGMGRQATAAPGAANLGGLGDILGRSLGAGSGGLGSVLLDQVLKREPTPTAPGNDILGEIFGSKDVSRGVAEEVAGSTGISSELLKKMLPILAMAVVGYMMNQKPGASGQTSGGPLGGALGGILGQVVSGMVRR